jgi:hypothetical protein
VIRVAYNPIMKTIKAILDPHADGSLHLPLPPELRGGRVKVEANLEAVPNESHVAAAPAATGTVLDALRELRTAGLGELIPDPVAWQRELRQDRPLPGRE